jgi:hypothetical protein
MGHMGHGTPRTRSQATPEITSRRRIPVANTEEQPLTQFHPRSSLFVYPQLTQYLQNRLGNGSSRATGAEMAYDHSTKAGNRGDVWKHGLLTLLADKIHVPQRAFHWLETHAGAPIHRLRAGGEWRDGIGSLAEKANLPYVARAIECARRGIYPAGWVLAAERLLLRCEHVVVTA